LSGEKGEEMTTRKDATHDLIMLALGAVDELWSRVFDTVKAWAGEETSGQVAEAMVGWRETYRAQQTLLESMAERLVRLEKRDDKVTRAREWTAMSWNNMVKRQEDLDKRLSYLEDDAGPRLSEADEVGR